MRWFDTALRSREAGAEVTSCPSKLLLALFLQSQLHSEPAVAVVQPAVATRLPAREVRMLEAAAAGHRVLRMDVASPAERYRYDQRAGGGGSAESYGREYAGNDHHEESVEAKRR